jgi:hypothetical protein
MGERCEDCQQRPKFCTCIVVCCDQCDAEIRLAGVLDDPNADEYCDDCLRQ